MKVKRPKRVKGLTEVRVCRTYFIDSEEGMSDEDIYEKAMEEFKVDWIELSPNRSDFIVEIKGL